MTEYREMGLAVTLTQTIRVDSLDKRLCHEQCKCMNDGYCKLFGDNTCLDNYPNRAGLYFRSLDCVKYEEDKTWEEYDQ